MSLYLSTLPVFVTWFSVGAALLLVFGSVYLHVTPWAELRLIRSGNIAAAVSFSGALLGYAIVLGSVLSHATSRGDLVAWGLVGLVVQIAAFFVARILLGSGLRERIEAGQLSSGILLATISLVAGVLNAATMVY